MQEIMWENQYRTTVVCVDSYENCVPAGRMYNACWDTGETFQSAIDFLKKTESLLDKMKFPQQFSANRMFQPPPEIRTESPPGGGEKRGGKVATFLLKILFRQNASWQGAVTWLEGNQEESFRSLLELLLLMDSAMGGSKPAKPESVSVCG